MLLIAVGCRTSSRPGLFSRKTPHEQYGKTITDAGLQSTVIGRAWFEAAETALSRPAIVIKPHKETGYFSADKPTAAGLQFNAVRGEKIQINVSKKPSGGFKLYLDLWEQDTTRGSVRKLLASSDTTGVAIEHEVEKTGIYILRLQPELLRDCEYTVEIGAVATLAFPVRSRERSRVQSFWGAARDAGARRHEGIDIFAARGTPVVAAADGRVTRVNQNNLGGKVVWMRPEKKNYTLYYAHLDSQLVTDGQQVRVGDTLGLMGNTGNARTTPPHLHFGIYTSGGAIDPFPFVNPEYPSPPDIRSDAGSVGDFVRVTAGSASLNQSPDAKSPSVKLERNTLLPVDAATANWYRVRLPDGRMGYVNAANTSKLATLRTITQGTEARLLTAPDSAAPAKKMVPAGSKLSLLAQFNDFQYVRADDNVAGWLMPPPRF